MDGPTPEYNIGIPRMREELGYGKRDPAIYADIKKSGVATQKRGRGLFTTEEGLEKLKEYVKQKGQGIREDEALGKENPERISERPEIHTFSYIVDEGEVWIPYRDAEVALLLQRAGKRKKE